MDKQKSLLVLGGGNDQVFAIKKAKDMNLRVICVDINKNSPGFNDGNKFIILFISEGAEDSRRFLTFLISWLVFNEPNAKVENCPIDL